jgi:hypothetical protein
MCTFKAKTMAFVFEKNKFAGPIAFQLPFFKEKSYVLMRYNVRFLLRKNAFFFDFV